MAALFHEHAVRLASWPRARDATSPSREGADGVGCPPDQALRDRIEALASRNTEGGLTDEERAEYEGYVRANKFLAVLRREARLMVEAAR
jgi:hypothetical protein